jgi:predicted DsbA family dithiol-disulfide isomerase
MLGADRMRKSDAPQGRGCPAKVSTPVSAQVRRLMPRVIVPVYFDYASTLCYVAWRIVRELEPELGFEALWKGVPIRLRDRQSRPGNSLGDLERMKVMTVIAETGIQVMPPNKWIDSDAALMGSELARDANTFASYHDGVFRAAFEERRDIASLDVLSEIAAASGLDGASFTEDIVKRRMAGRIAQNKDEADRFSALGYPTFILGDFPLIGIQPENTMRLLLQRFIDKRRNEPRL